MRKATKGVLGLAVGAALLGGSGTLAYWSDSRPIGGGAITSGHLAIVTDATNTGCASWMLDTGEAPPQTYAVGNRLVPGDVLTRSCAFTVDASGNHLRATVGISGVSFSGAAGNFGGKLTATVSAVRLNGSPVTSFTEAADGATLSASVTVTFDSTAGNTTQNLTTFLDTLTLTATQVHA